MSYFVISSDAYMCVTNLMKPQPDHAKRIALFSMDAIEAAASTPVDLEDETMGTINIRVGKNVLSYIFLLTFVEHASLIQYHFMIKGFIQGLSLQVLSVPVI